MGSGFSTRRTVWSSWWRIQGPCTLWKWLWPPYRSTHTTHQPSPSSYSYYDFIDTYYNHTLIITTLIITTLDEASPPTNHQPSSSYSYYNYNFIDTYYNHNFIDTYYNHNFIDTYYNYNFIDTYYNHNFIDTYYNYYPPHTIRHTTTIRVYIF